MKKVLWAFLSLSVLVGSANAQRKSISEKAKPVFLNVGNDLNSNEIIVTWLDPKDPNIKTHDTSIKVRLGINSPSEIKSVNFLVNDLQPVEERGLKVTDQTGYDQFDKFVVKDLALAIGENEIKVQVENTDGKISTSSRMVQVMEEEILARTDYALLFATNDYANWGDLVNPLFDAQTIAKELEENFNFNVELVTNANQAEILVKLKDYATKNYLPNDQLFIFFAGHGQYDEIYNEGYIVSADSEFPDPAKTSYIAHSNLSNIIDNIPSEHTFVVMDVCFGGTFDKAIAQEGHRGIENDPVYQEITQTEYIKRKHRYRTRKYVTSGGKEYVPDGRPGYHSPFARKFIEALRTKGGPDNMLTIAEIVSFIERINPEPRSGGFGKDQIGSDFLFISN